MTRLAPSPTGSLHLGNVRTFLVNWALARKRNWRIVLRIEDLDTPRVKAGAADRLIDTLTWLGLDWDDGPIVQSADLTPYREAVRRLAQAGLAYPCDLTRGQIEVAASAPHGSRGGPDEPRESRFPHELRPALHPRQLTDEATNWRFVVPDRPVEFRDGFAGPRTARPAESVGDFVIWTKRRQPSYQLAVVVDDARQGVTQVVRGDDLLDSTGRQILLYEALNLSPRPAYTHLPLVIGPDGRRLAKRHGDTRIDRYRQIGVPAEAVIGLIARWTLPGAEGGTAGPMDAAAFMADLDLSRIPSGPVVCSPEDDAWLRSHAR